MYHEAKNWYHSYYDTIEEMPQVAKVYFPDEKEPRLLSADEMIALSVEGWYTIMHSVNWGSCDHWTSQPLTKWVYDRFLSYVRYTNSKGETVGYDRKEWSVKLTKDSKYWKSAVWNS